MRDWKTCVDIYKEYVGDQTLSKKEIAVKYGLSQGAVAEIISFFNTTREVEDVVSFGDYFSNYSKDPYVLLKKLRRVGVYTKAEFDILDKDAVLRTSYFGADNLEVVRKIKGWSFDFGSSKCPYCHCGDLIETSSKMSHMAVIKKTARLSVYIHHVSKEDALPYTETISVRINYCPMCGKKLRHNKK